MNALGVGLTYQDALRPFVERHWDDLDYLEVVPDTVWRDRGARAKPRYVYEPGLVRFLDEARTRVPIVAHSIGQSIGSADRFDGAHAEQIRRFHERFGFAWHSDHLSYHLTNGGSVNAGFTLPIHRDRAMLRLLKQRVARVLRGVPAPFLLETNVYFFAFPEEELDEATFLNRLCEESGCGLLLDLHNVHTNARNHGFDAGAFLDRLDLSHVVEVHLAGGMEHHGFYLDAHSGATPEPVWKLLEHALPRLTALRGITFELFEDWVRDVTETELRDELARIRDAWKRRPTARAA